MSDAPKPMNAQMWGRLFSVVSVMYQEVGRDGIWKDIYEFVLEQRRLAYTHEHEEAEARCNLGNYKDDELTYAAYARCACGAGLAYAPGIGMHGFWDCSDILTGRAIPNGQPGSVQHSARYPFVFYEIKSEDQPSAQGATTRRSKS